MPRQFSKLAHSLYECKYHIVFCPKYRYKILDTVASKYVHQEIYRLCNQKSGVEILELWGQHVWSRGYCVSTVGLDEDRIRKYVKWQSKKEEKFASNQDRLFD